MIKDERGSITAEYAICLPVVTVLIVLIVSLISLSGTQTKCNNTAALLLRSASEVDDPTSAKNLQMLDEQAKTALGKDYGDDYELEVEKVDEIWVKIRLRLPIHNRILKAFLKNVSSDLLGRFDA
jgi:Flp pilus assembly pilin Flp